MKLEARQGARCVPRPSDTRSQDCGLRPTQLAHSLHEGGSPLALRRCGTRAEQSEGRGLRLLHARRERPCRRAAAEQRDELAALHSITSSAATSSPGGTSMPSALAVLKLITNSNLVFCT